MTGSPRPKMAYHSLMPLTGAVPLCAALGKAGVAGRVSHAGSSAAPAGTAAQPRSAATISAANTRDRLARDGFGCVASSPVIPGLVPGIHVDAPGSSPWAEGPRNTSGPDEKQERLNLTHAALARIRIAVT